MENTSKIGQQTVLERFVLPLQGTHTQGVFEAVRRGFLVALSILLPALAEEQGLLVEEKVPLHGLETGQIFHLSVAFLVFRPDTEGALHQ